MDSMDSGGHRPGQPAYSAGLQAKKHSASSSGGGGGGVGNGTSSNISASSSRMFNNYELSDELTRLQVQVTPILHCDCW